MNKYFTVLVLLLVITCNFMEAKNPYYPTRTRDEAKINNGVIFGIKGGLNCPRLYYTNSYLTDLPHDFMMGVSASTFVEFPFLKIIAIAPEFNYQQRGGTTSYIYEEIYNVSYRVEAYYVSLRAPFICYIPASKTVRPYLFVAPDAGYVTSGRISLSQPELDIEGSEIRLNNSNINRYYLGLLGGAGIRMNIPLRGFTMVIKTDAAINFGFIDTFSESEHQETATSTNVHAYNHQGKRYSRGLEIHLGIGFIRNKEDDVCGHFNSYHPKHIRY